MSEGTRRTAQLAGYYAAHAIWSVSEGDTLLPLLAFEDEDGERSMSRLSSEELGDAVTQGQRALGDNVDDAARGALLYDGYVTLSSGKFDAVFIEVKDYATRSGFMMAVPYRHASDPAGFGVHAPKFLRVEGPDPDFALLSSQFFEGVEAHEEGSRIWNLSTVHLH